MYFARWYKHNLSVQKLVLYVMLKSQQVHYFSGAGLIDINVNAFASVSRALQYVVHLKSTFDVLGNQESILLLCNSTKYFEQVNIKSNSIDTLPD